MVRGRVWIRTCVGLLLVLFCCGACVAPTTTGKAAKAPEQNPSQGQAEQKEPQTATKADRLIDVKVQEGPNQTIVILTANGPFRDYQFIRLGDSRFSLDLTDLAGQSDLPALPVPSELINLNYDTLSGPSQGVQLLGTLSRQLDRYEVQSLGNNLSLVLYLAPAGAPSKTFGEAPPAPACEPAKTAKKKGQKQVSASRAVHEGGASERTSIVTSQPPAGQTSTESVSLLRKTYTGKPISFDFLDVDVRNALRLIADLTGTNIVIEPDVAGKVTLKVNQVPWDQVLDLILVMNNLAKEQTGNVIRIARQSKLQDEYTKQVEQIKARQDLLETTKDAGEITTEYLTVNYAPVGDVAAKIAEVKSSKGKISVDERTNLIIYSDYPNRIQSARQLMARLDKATAQVMIEARLVTMSEVFTRQVGVVWGFNVADARTPPADFAKGFQVNYLSNALGSLLGYHLGTVIGQTLFKLDATLSAGETMSQVKILAAPKVLTLNNVKALISQGTQIPYLQLTGENVTSVVFKDAVIELGVTPHITPDHKIRLEIEAKQDDQGQDVPLGLGQNVPSIDTRRIKTELLVDDGNIIVIGGVIRDRNLESKTTTPGLGDVPILGSLFKSNNKVSDRRELMIFISPKIVELSAGNYGK